MLAADAPHAAETRQAAEAVDSITSLAARSRRWGAQCVQGEACKRMLRLRLLLLLLRLRLMRLLLLRLLLDLRRHGGSRAVGLGESAFGAHRGCRWWLKTRAEHVLPDGVLGHGDG